MLKKLTVMVLVVITLLAFRGLALADNELRMVIWRDYYSPEVIKDFETANNCKVIITHVDTYDQVFKLLKYPEICDLVITGELAFPELIKNGMLEPLSKNLIPNMKNLDPLFNSLCFDPNNTYSLPYHYSYIGLIYNKDRVKLMEATLQNYFEAPAKFRGKLTTFPNSRIMIGMAMKYLGRSFNSTDKASLDLVKQLLVNFKETITAKGKDINRGIFDSYVELMNGEAYMSIGYAAESASRVLKAGNIGFLIPKEGAHIDINDMAIVKGAKNKELAHKFINYLYTPSVAAKSVTFLGAPIPVMGVKGLLKPEVANNPAIYPPAEIVRKLEFMTPMTEAQLLLYEKLWAEVFGR